MSESGRIAYKFCYEISEHFSFVSLEEFVVMPNHVHGIIIIQSPSSVVGTLHATSLQSVQNEFMSHISPKPGSLAAVIRSYKSAVSKNIHLSDHGFSWQPRYYDHIIHSARELDRIRDYIINNPVKWES
jgi:REP element-mobilizing transposase RayT